MAERFLVREGIVGEDGRAVRDREAGVAPSLT
jgi:hypothetical protein